jgi:alkanesulfonate monooxygenase SsuD/methylene tetrahydromethanopterin reductase-like flavin-dependent oxidoreductase (luciferase family)
MVVAPDRLATSPLARKADEAGFESVFLTEAAGANAFMDGAHIAASTDGILVSIGIVNVYSRSPSLIAMSGAHLDQLSAGRAVVCLGASTRPLIEGVHGIPFEDPIERMRDDRQRIGLARAAPEHHGPEAQLADLDPGSPEIAIFHPCDCPCRNM